MNECMNGKLQAIKEMDGRMKNEKINIYLILIATRTTFRPNEHKSFPFSEPSVKN